MEGSWLKFLELNPFTIFAVFLASLAVLLLKSFSLIDLQSLPAWSWTVLLLCAILTGALTITNALEAGLTFMRRRNAAKLAIELNNAKNTRTLNYLDSLTANEREVLSFLVQKHGQSFTAAMGAGTVAMLLQKGLVVQSPGNWSILDVPYYVSEHVWKTLQERKQDFNTANLDGPHPWRERII